MTAIATPVDESGAFQISVKFLDFWDTKLLRVADGWTLARIADSHSLEICEERCRTGKICATPRAIQVRCLA